MALTNRRVILSSRPRGVPTPDHFTVEEVSAAPPGPGEFQIRTEMWSVDPAMRGWVNEAPNYLPPVEIGAPMRSYAVGTVTASNHPDYATGDVVKGMFGWQRYAISNGSDVEARITNGDLRASLYLGILGINGLTAYLCLTSICEPKLGETVVVSTAAGAVGSAVGQIAKIMGCRTVGITSSSDKAALCRDHYGYDAVVNYKTDDIAAAVKSACPNGVDCYFDNTCGPISDAVMTNLALGARIAICGTAALTDWDPIPQGPRVHRQLLVARARMQGFIIFDHADRYAEAVEVLSNWLGDGRLSYREHILEGAEAARDAIGMLYRGENTGKLLIRPD